MKIIFSLQFEVSSKVQTTYLFISSKFFSRSMFKDFPFNQKICAVADRKCLVYIVIGDQNSYVFVFQPRNNSLYIFHSDGIHPGEWFIQQHKIRIDCKCTCDFSSSSFTPAQG